MAVVFDVLSGDMQPSIVVLGQISPRHSLERLGRMSTG